MSFLSGGCPFFRWIFFTGMCLDVTRELCFDICYMFLMTICAPCCSFRLFFLWFITDIFLFCIFGVTFKEFLRPFALSVSGYEFARVVLFQGFRFVLIVSLETGYLKIFLNCSIYTPSEITSVLLLALEVTKVLFLDKILAEFKVDKDPLYFIDIFCIVDFSFFVFVCIMLFYYLSFDLFFCFFFSI